MTRVFLRIGVVLLLTLPLMAQGKRVWVLREAGEMVEYDPATFAAKQTVKVPAEAVKSPEHLSVNALGQMLFFSPVALPLAEDDDTDRTIWFWDGKKAVTLAVLVTRKAEAAGSNLAIEEEAARAALSVDGGHLYWFSNSARRLQREDVDLSTKNTWRAWRTDLSGNAREELASAALPDCRCTTGSCEDSCAYGEAWVADDGVGKYFVLTQVVEGQTQASYKASAVYRDDAGKWANSALDAALHRMLDAEANGDAIVEAIPDTGCCGWSNDSDDQTLLHLHGKTLTMFDERETFKNPDYDVSFRTSTARLSPDLAYLAMAIVASAQANQPIQMAQEGQANPEESQRIRKALADLPAVEVKSVDTPHRVAYVPHATLVGWLGEKELLLVEDHLLVTYNVATGARRKSSVRVEDAGRVFLR
jgi:hypothetical protein